MNKALGFLILALGIALLIIDNDPMLFVDWFGLGVVIAVPFGVTFFSYGNYTFSVFGYVRKPIQSQKDYMLAISFFDNLANTAIVTGVAATLIGHVAILSNVDSVTDLLPATSVSYLTTLYGFLLAKLLFEPLKQNIVRKGKLSNINALVQQHLTDNVSLASKQVNFALIVSVISTLLLLAVIGLDQSLQIYQIMDMPMDLEMQLPSEQEMMEPDNN